MADRPHSRQSSAGGSGYSQSLERGLAILSTFRGSRPLLGISELAREVDMTTSTVHRYVATLASLGYLEQDGLTRKYRLGPRLLDLGLAALDSMELRDVAAPHLRRLSDETGYTANMAILDGVDIVYVERCRSGRSGQSAIDLNLHVGSRLPAYCTSMGKVLLAFLPEDSRSELLDRIQLAKRGPNTLTDRDELDAQLAQVRRDGIATNNEELAYGLRSIAAPVFRADGEVAAAINLAVHSSMGASSINAVVSHLAPALRRTATEISARIGYRPRS